MSTYIETVPTGVNLEAFLNGKTTGIVESCPERAFSYFAQRNIDGWRNAIANGERTSRKYTLRRTDNHKEYHFISGQWRSS